MSQRGPAKFIGLAVAMVCILNVGAAPASAYNSVSDDFSGDSGAWDLTYGARRSSGSLEVVPSSSGSVGVAWLKQDVRYPFTVEFRFQVSTGGEGLVFLFHKNKSYTPAGGGALGFNPSGGGAGGWGVEFDVRATSGYGEPGAHVGLIRDEARTHLKTDTSISFNNGGWHSVKVYIERSRITLTYDGNQAWRFADYAYSGSSGSGMGFSAAGGSGGAARVDDFKLYNPADAELFFWVTFGVAAACIVFGTLGGIVIWAGSKRKAILRDYAQPGVDYKSFNITPDLRTQIVGRAKNAQDPHIQRLYEGYRKSYAGVSVAGFLMVAAIIGTLFMPAIIMLFVGVPMQLVFIGIFVGAVVRANRHTKPFIVLIGQRTGFFSPPGAPGAAPGQYGPPPLMVQPWEGSQYGQSPQTQPPQYDQYQQPPPGQYPPRMQQGQYPPGPYGQPIEGQYPPPQQYSPPPPVPYSQQAPYFPPAQPPGPVQPGPQWDSPAPGEGYRRPR